MLLNNNKIYKNIIELIIIFLPISLLFSNTISELLILILLIFYFKFFKIENLKYILNDPIIKFLILFWIYLILNYFINFNNNPSLERSLLFIRFPLLILAMSFFINNLNISLNKIYKCWLIIVSIACVDLIFQFYNHKNLIGYEAVIQGSMYRLGGFMDDELKISNLLFQFGTLSFSFFIFKENLKKNMVNLIIILFLFLLIISIFLTGERSNFLTICIFTVFLIIFFGFKKKVIFLILSTLFLVFLGLVVSNNSELSNRMFKNLIVEKNKIFSSQENKNFLYKNSHYFAHYSTAYQIFKENKLFGVGVKNFRNYCDNDKFNAEIWPGWRAKKCSTHPHNYYFELLSELGLIGFIVLNSFFLFSFYCFLKIYQKSKNTYLLVGSLIILAHFIPFLPRGSFFTNWNAMIFWTVFSFVYSNYIKIKNTK
tara:strand:- start:1613 stop:2893 length:1281 start_codon:yes stop_codon:yes gene_type:complete